MLNIFSTREKTLHAINSICTFIKSYMLYKLIGLLMNNDSPIVVVLSESMSPGFERGDILFLTPRITINNDDYKHKSPYKVGDMVVFQVKKGEIPIIHRAIRKYGTRILTKGDNNMYNDVGLYRPGQKMLDKHEITLRVIANLPFFGMITIWVITYPIVKFMSMVASVLLLFLEREE